MAHRLQIDVVPIVRMSNHEGLINLDTKGIPLELAHPIVILMARATSELVPSDRTTSRSSQTTLRAALRIPSSSLSARKFLLTLARSIASLAEMLSASSFRVVALSSLAWREPTFYYASSRSW